MFEYPMYIDVIAASGYVWLYKTLGIFLLSTSGIFVGIASLGIFYTLFASIAGPYEGQGLAADIIKQVLCVLFVTLVLFNPVVKPIKDFAPVSDAFVGKVGTGKGLTFWPTEMFEKLYQASMYTAVRMANPDNHLLVPAAAQAAYIVATDPIVTQDTQYRAARKMWRDVIAPYVATKDPVSMNLIVTEGLSDAFMNMYSSKAGFQGRFTSTQREKQSTRVAEILQKSTINLADGSVAGINPSLEQASLGGTAWVINASGLQGALLSEQSTASPIVKAYKSPAQCADTSPTSKDTNCTLAPPDKAVEAKRKAAFDIGYSVLNRFQDQKISPTPYKNLSELYLNLGYVSDVSAARAILSDQSKIIYFGAGCQAVGETGCISQMQGASTVQQIADGDGIGIMGTLGNTAAGILSMKEALVAKTAGSIAKGQIPFIIGTVKAILIIITPILLYLMLWPGKAGFVFQSLFCGHLFLLLWAVFYVIWETFGMSMGGDLTQASQKAQGALNFSGYNAVTTLSTAIQAGLAGAAFAIAFSATSSFGRMAGSALSSAGKTAGGLVAKAGGAVGGAVSGGALGAAASGPAGAAAGALRGAASSIVNPGSGGALGKAIGAAINSPSQSGAGAAQTAMTSFLDSLKKSASPPKSAPQGGLGAGAGTGSPQRPAAGAPPGGGRLPGKG